YHTAFQNFRFGYGAALSVILVIIGIIAALLYLKAFGFEALMERPRIEVD
ncbi:MAG: sugar ABC transporter permease, partial [Thermotoga sp.]